MTDGQVGKIAELITATLRKVRGNFHSTDVQNALERSGSTIQEKFLKLFQELVEATAQALVRTVKVNRNRSQEEMLKALRFLIYMDPYVVSTIPVGQGEDVTVEFFKLDKSVSEDALALEYEKRGLVPDIYAQAAVNEADPNFTDAYPNSTYWKNDAGNWCRIEFQLDLNTRAVSVFGVNDMFCDTDKNHWFGGVRKIK